MKFWLVWNEIADSPTHKHDNYLKACNEAVRLARLYPNQRFHVLEWIGTVVPIIVWDGKDPKTDPDFIPF